MSDLIERLEALEAPCRGMDAEIHHWHLDGLGTGYRQDAPLYTRSIDAAVTLVPDGWNWTTGIEEGNQVWANVYPSVQPFHLSFDITTSAATPAIGLCIAALKAGAITTQHMEKE